MNAEAPDPKSLNNWEDAFAYPIPVVRRIEQQVRSDILTTRERLRSLVGGSYRDLLGTAETIIDMDGKIHSVESVVADVGRRCNTGLLDRTKKQSRNLTMQSRSTETATYALASQLSVFRACPDVVLRLLRKGGSLLTAAKVVVISRILHKKLKESGRFYEIIETILERLGRVRSKLLEAIERRFSTLPIKNDDLLDAMSAYALVTTSSAADILRHFHHARLSAVIDSIREDDMRQPDPVKGLQIWLQTLRDTQRVFPRELALALSRLKVCPLLKSQDVQDISAFDLDVHQAWLGEVVRGFIPYIRHDDLDMAAAKKQLSTWAPQALGKYLEGLRMNLKAIDELSKVAELRQKCLTAWFSGSSRIVGVPRSEVLQGLRNAFAERLDKLTELGCESLDKVSTQIKTTLETWTPQTALTNVPTMWSKEMYTMDISHGAKRFTNSLQASLQGRSHSLNACLKKYREWLKNIENIEDTIEEQKKIRWQDMSDDFEDDYEEEDSRDLLLSRDDPQELQNKLTTSVDKAVASFQRSMAQTSEHLESSPFAEKKAAFLLRFLRDVRVMMPSSYSKSFSIEFTNSLYRIVANSVTGNVISRSEKRISRAFQNRDLAMRILWSDESLPILPSPWAFKLIKECHSAMETAGHDLWTAAAVQQFRRVFIDDLGEALARARATSQINGAKEEPTESSGSHDHIAGAKEKAYNHDTYLQQIFDVVYLSAATSTKEGDLSTAMREHLHWLQDKTDLDMNNRERIEKSANDYWKRTSLLFGLLCV